MAGEIFVGSVGVSVVPNLRGFNDRMRAELVPSAGVIGSEIGKEISKGIADNLNIGDIVTKGVTKAMPSIRASAAVMGASFGRAFKNSFNDATKDLTAKVSIDKESVAKMRRVINLALKDAFTIKVKADIDQTSLLKIALAARVAAASGAGGGAAGASGGGVTPLDDLINRLISRGGGGGKGGGVGGVAAAAAGDSGGGGVFGSTLLASLLPGGTRVSTGVGSAIASLGAPGAVGIGGIAAAALPLIAQQLSGGLVAGLGGGLAGLGIAGALMGNVSGQAATTAAALRYNAAQLRVTAAQDRLNKLETSGKATAAQLASAHASVASAMATAATAGDKFSDVNARSAGNVAALQGAFNSLEPTAKAAMTEIGAAFTVPLTQIFKLTDFVINDMTPVFAGASKIIAGPFKILADTVLTSFTSPQVKSSITAVANAFAGILTAFTPDIPGIMNSMADAIERIALAVSKNPKAFADFINFLFQIVIFSVNAIAFLTDVADYVEAHFTPAMHRIAVVFDGVRHDVAHIWDQIFENSIGMVIRLTHNIETQFNSMRHEIAVIFDGMRHDIAHVWDMIYENTVGRVIRLWQITGSTFANQRHDVSMTMDGMRHDIARYWDLIYQDSIGRVIRMMHDVESFTDRMRHDVSSTYDLMRHDISAVWDQIYSDTIARVVRMVTTVDNKILGFKNYVITLFHDAGSWLVKAGGDVIGGLLNGIDNAIRHVGTWIKAHVVDPIVNNVKHYFGIASPSTVMGDIGDNLMQSLMSSMLKTGAKGIGNFIKLIFGGWPQALGGAVSKTLIDITKLPAKALQAIAGLTGSAGKAIGGFFSKLFGGGTSGVSQWTGTVIRALAMLGLPLSLAGNVLHQMQTESGGNVNAINLTDINAQRGDPSRGLMQVIGGTFAQYHVAGTSGNIYDPLANIAAALNYAMHVYGPTLMRGGMGVGSGHGYAAGTGSDGAAAGWAWVGENGPELVNFNGGESVLPIGGYATGTSSAVAAFNRMVTAGTSLAASLAKITLSTTASTFGSDQSRFLADLRLYFSPATDRARSNLVISQINELKSLQTHIKTLSTNIAQANTYQAQELGRLKAYGGVTQIGIQGVGAQQGSTLLSGLQSQVSVLNNFGKTIKDLRTTGASASVIGQVAAMDPASGTDYGRKMITALNKMKALKLPAGMMTQLIAAGPDAAIAYADALKAASPATLKAIIGTETALEATRASVSRGVTSVVEGGAYNTGVNFVNGLKSQQKVLESQFAHLGKTLGQEAIKWMRVPANKRPYGYATGGWINEPVSGIGQYSGALYTFAERGREYVIPEGGARGGDGGSAQYHAHFDGLTGQAIEGHVRTAFTAMSLTQGRLQRQGRRS